MDKLEGTESRARWREPVFTLRLSTAEASRMSVGELVELTREHRVLLTRNGSVVAVVDVGERLDEALELVEYAAELIRRVAADAFEEGGRAERLRAVCAELGLDPGFVARRSAAFRDGAGDSSTTHPGDEWC